MAIRKTVPVLNCESSHRFRVWEAEYLDSAAPEMRTCPAVTTRSGIAWGGEMGGV